MDIHQDDIKSFVKEHYPNTIKDEKPDGSLEFRTSIFFKSLNPKKRSSVILVGNFNILSYGSDIQFIHFAGRDTDFDNNRIISESNEILAEKSFYLYSKKQNSLKFFGLYRCKFIEDKTDVISFFNRLNRKTKSEEYRLKRVLVLKKVLTLEDLGARRPLK